MQFDYISMDEANAQEKNRIHSTAVPLYPKMRPVLAENMFSSCFPQWLKVPAGQLSPSHRLN